MEQGKMIDLLNKKIEGLNAKIKDLSE